MRQVRRPVLAVGAASTLGLLCALAGPAVAAVGRPGVPQASGPFKIGPSSSPGSVALDRAGDRVAVFDVSAGHGKTRVCLIARAGRRCWHSTLLSPPGTASTFGTPGVFILSPSHVVVLQNTCCEVNPNGTVLYASANGGKTFSAPVRVGRLGVDHSEFVGGQVLFTAQDDASGLQVVSVPVGAGGPSPTATIASRVAVDTGLGQYKGGVLIGADSSGSPGATYAYYAARGKNFDVASSYHQVAKFRGESLLAMSGGALLTDRSKGNVALLRMFNGTRFGPARAVPHVHGGLGTWFTITQDPGGHVHILAILASASYHLLEVSTSNGGKTWTGAVNLGNAIQSTRLSAAINAHGQGLVLGNSPARGYPVP